MNDGFTMAKHLRDALVELRELGCAVAVFDPDELRGADPNYIEAVMIGRGSAAIDVLGTEDTPEED